MDGKKVPDSCCMKDEVGCGQDLNKINKEVCDGNAVPDSCCKMIENVCGEDIKSINKINEDVCGICR